MKNIRFLLVAVLALNVPDAAAQFAKLDSTFSGDTYSFEHQLGFFNSSTGMPECSSPHTSGTDDNVVTFDGQTELLDPYSDGTQPFVFEFEFENTNNDEVLSLEFETFASGGGGDLFPDGFTDPGTSTPLDGACVEIGQQDPLESGVSRSVAKARIDFLDASGSSLFGGPVPITSFFNEPWDGTLSLVVSGLAGQNVNQVKLEIDTALDQELFADGFESGDVSAWSRAAAPKTSGEIDVTEEAALGGNFGLDVDISDPAEAFVEDDSPNDDFRHRTEFMLDPNSVNLADGEQVAIFAGKDAGGNVVFRIWLRREGSNYTLFAESIDNDGSQQTTFQKTIADAPQKVGIVWQAALSSGSCDGLMKLFINDEDQEGVFLLDLDNDAKKVASVQLGLVDGQGLTSASSGSFFLDEFASFSPSGSGAGPNNAPLALPDSFSTDEDIAAILDILAHDTDPDDDDLTVTVPMQPPNGTVEINPDSSVTYTPNTNFFGTDSFSYMIDDARGGTDEATVQITVHPINDAPGEATIFNPPPNATVVLEGDPSTPFIVQWNPAEDVEGDPVDYVYQLSPDTTFDDVVLSGTVLAGENRTSFEGTVGGVADSLGAAGIDVFPAQMHHRVISSDTALATIGPSTAITFGRGDITATEDDDAVPTAFALHDNYPNPFNPETTISFDVRAPTRVVLDLYDALGKHVATLVDRPFSAGRYRVPFDAAGLPSGLYVYRVRMGDFSAAKKMVLLK